MFKVPSFGFVCLALVCLLPNCDAYPSKHNGASTESLEDLRNEYEAQLSRFKETKYRLQLAQARYSLMKLKLPKEEDSVNKIKGGDLCKHKPCQPGFHCVPTNDGQTDGQTDGQAYECVKNLDENLADPERLDPGSGERLNWLFSYCNALKAETMKIICESDEYAKKACPGKCRKLARMFNTRK